METQPEQPKEQLEDETVSSEEVVEEEPVEEAVSGDDPLTGEEIKSAVTDSWNHAKNAWLRPARKEVRRGFNQVKKFLDDLGGDK